MSSMQAQTDLAFEPFCRGTVHLLTRVSCQLAVSQVGLQKNFQRPSSCTYLKLLDLSLAMHVLNEQQLVQA